MTIRITGDAGPRATLADVVAALAGGQPCAVIDPLWPASWRHSVELDLARHRPGADLVAFTSGSTARPRGVVRTAASWTSSHAPLADLVGITAADVVWLPGPLASTLFLYGAVHACAVGAATVLLDEDPTDSTVVHTTPAGLDEILDRVAAGGLPRLRLAIAAGDALTVDRRSRGASLGIQVVSYYGAAELSFVAIDDDGRGLRPFPGVDIDLRDAGNGALVWVRSPYLALGYLGGTGPMRRDEAWATVGDIGHWVSDADGPRLAVMGRGDLAVTTAGHTVLVEDVEAALRGIPGVHDVAVTGLPHATLGAILVAVVVTSLDAADLRRAAQSLPAATRPRRWLHVAELPRTAGGKIRRDLVRTIAEDPR